MDLDWAIKLSLQRVFAEADRIVAVTGSGVSAESGIPTFRDSDNGLWSKYSPYELATPDAFARDKELVWGWYQWRRSLVLQAQPNAGHLALATMQRCFDDFTLVTQNVDDLHERAGSQQVIHLHGEIAHPYCSCCGAPHRLDDRAEAVDEPLLRVKPPDCGRCQEPVRPGVVWFGEPLPVAAWKLAESATINADVLLCLGTSGLVFPAAGLPQTAKDEGATVIQINPLATPLDCVAHYNLRGASGVLLPQLLDLLP